MSHEPTPANGEGAALFDTPSLFYLTNRALIDEWHSLRGAVAANLDEWFTTVVGDALEAKASEQSLVLTRGIALRSYHYVLLHTAEAMVGDDEPVIGVGLGWSRKP